VPHLQLETTIRAPIEACFDLSLSVDAHAASMTASAERPIAGVMSGLMQLGDTVTWRSRHFGLPFRLTSRITAYERPARFVDEQIRGPFALWHHEHLFEPGTANLTRMLDRIDFRSPAGPVGVLVDRLVLARYMRRLIERRNAHLKATLEASPR
jgi:ligand-binding SRPBCC domain-containing protein